MRAYGRLRRCGGTSKGRKQLSPLSQREAEVLELVRTGHTTKDIAAQLGISTSTVLWHRKLAFARQTAAAAPNRAPSSRTTSTKRSTSASAVRQLTIAGRQATTPR
jgi:DNA-binding CsgD family transcriptional regulator